MQTTIKGLSYAAFCLIFSQCMKVDKVWCGALHPDTGEEFGSMEPMPPKMVVRDFYTDYPDSDKEFDNCLDAWTYFGQLSACRIMDISGTIYYDSLARANRRRNKNEKI